MKLLVKDTNGAQAGTIEVSDAIFGVPMNDDLVHQALTWQRTNSRVGTQSALTRHEVSGSRRKPWRQKHTGRARAGRTRSPLWRHGGVSHAPKPRDHSLRIPRKMRRLAIRCLLSSKQTEGALTILHDMVLAEGKAKEMVALLKALELIGTTLIVTLDKVDLVVRAASNIPGVRTLPARQLNVGDLLKYQHLVMTVDAVHRAEELWAGVAGEAMVGVDGAPVAVASAPAPAPAKRSRVAASKAAPASEDAKPKKRAATMTRSRKARETQARKKE